MINMTHKARKAAKELAIAYEAYCDARRESDYDKVIMWAGILIDAQNKMEIWLQDESLLQHMIKISREALGEE